MNKVIRVISALGAGASLVWGIARSVRRKKGSTDDGGPDWPPKDAEQAAKPVEHEAPAAEAPSEPEASDDVVEDESEETPVQDEAEAAPEPDPSEEDEADAGEGEDEAEEDEADAGDVDTDDEEPPVVKGVAFENPAAVVELVNRVDEEGLKDLGRSEEHHV